MLDYNFSNIYKYKHILKITAIFLLPCSKKKKTSFTLSVSCIKTCVVVDNKKCGQLFHEAKAN